MTATAQQIQVGDYLIAIELGETTDGDPFIQLRGINCNLEGEEPGLYFPTPLEPKQKQVA